MPANATAPTSKDGPVSLGSKPVSQPSQKSMTKAERRELQERQRAAKLAQKEQPPGSSNTVASTSKSKQTSTPQKKAADTNKPAASLGKDTSIAVKDAALSVAAAADSVEAQKSRGLRIFSHFGAPKPLGAGVKGDIHPAIVRLGLLFSEFKVCGANARCIATLSAFKIVIQDYTTPPNNTLSRHLMTHLSPQITYLVSARPMSVTMGNAIRQLKLEISGSDIDLPEQDAKDAICQKIDNYIRDRIIIADEVIQDLAGKKIKDGDVILTHARSSLVQKILLHAHAEGKRFSVIVVDSRPLLEGKKLLHALTSTEPPIPCTYAFLSALPSVVSEATTVLVGAHSLHSNGAVYSRAGTALVAMMAKAHGVPVVVCCETYKFSETVMLDGFGKNELAPAKFSPSEPKPNPTLEVLNPLYDVTPPSSITAVVTEVGMIPPTSISSISLALGKTSM
ncbi:eukaryotic translation initiation factor 2B delta subunit [Armillaria mellea]|nr:eukaryotic translation initiation factor 2B delta subunit [Armillaria mellea]